MIFNFICKVFLIFNYIIKNIKKKIILNNSKIDIEIAFELWDLYIIENDKCFIFFISLALLIINKPKLMSIDLSQLP